MLKDILGVITGYSIFVVSSILLFQLSGQNPHAPASVVFQLFTSLYGCIFSFLGGLVLQLIVRRNSLTLNYVLAFIIAGFATFSLFKAEGSHWTQLFAIIIFAPVSILGGLIRKRN